MALIVCIYQRTVRAWRLDAQFSYDATMGWSRTAIWLAGAAAGLAAMTTAASCTTFDTENDPTPDAASDTSTDGDGAAPDAAGDAEPLDGGSMPALTAVCPPPSGGVKPAESWEKRPLYMPSVARMYPFAIATDATHVTWVAQLGTAADSGLPDNAPYNGIGEGHILRVPKQGGKTVTLARAQRYARSLALDGDHAYWAIYDTDNVARLVRQRRDADCDAGCAAPELVTSFPPGSPIVTLRRAAPGVLFALRENGPLFRFVVGSLAPEPVLTSGDYPALTVTDKEAFLSAGTVAEVGRAGLTSGAPNQPLVAIPPLDGGPVGVAPIATDCTSLWMIRELSQPQVLKVSIADASSLVTLANRLTINAFDLAADSRFVYAASPNAGGVFAIDKNNGASVLLRPGNVFRLAVDSEGIYFGEHDRSGAGALIMIVKK